MNEAIIQIRNLSVNFPSEAGNVQAVRDLSLDVRAGEVLGLVGESGSGKSVTSLSMIGLLPPTARVTGEILYQGKNLLELSDDEMSKYRGSDIAMVFQDPLSALNPVRTIGNQIAEAILIHRNVSEDVALKRAVELLDIVGIPRPDERVNSYPHEFSGGMRQRVMIALAIANEPKVLLADEPTTALDVTVQAQILEVLQRARDITGAAIVLVTHDLGVVAGLADRVAIMYAGKIVEVGDVASVYAQPSMPYTIGLLRSIPRIDAESGSRLASIAGAPPSPVNLPSGCAFSPRCPAATDSCSSSVPELTKRDMGRLTACHRHSEIQQMQSSGNLFVEGPAHVSKRDESLGNVLEVEALKKTFPMMKGSVLRRRVGSIFAVDGVDLTLRKGRSLALVGESGCGKTTTLLEIMNLVAPESGSISVLGRNVSSLSKNDRLQLRKDLQIVFQDPFASLDPRLPIGDAIAEPLRAFKIPREQQDARISELLSLVGLNPDHASRYPSEFSGGQRQRIAIARALALNPQLVVLDEPVSALDVSVRAGVLNLLAELQEKLGLSYLFVSHDLAVVQHVADDIAVMYLGSIVESGPVADVFANPQHPYTQALLSAVPIPDPVIEKQRKRIVLQGELPSPANPPSGCRFHNRCHVRSSLPEDVASRCSSDRPVLTSRNSGAVSCHAPLN
ncbi:MAG: ABC transporter ATP-binding protein [Actinobacteria bacterium]|nr:ABC transporter ATP-binding protein [Actinomycetota bacterium]